MLYTPGFSVPTEQLTTQGMRQRFLLGRYNYHKYKDYYFEKYQLNMTIYPTIYMQSTDYYRTLQSGYSEQMGLQYEILNNFNIKPYLTSKQVVDLNMGNNSRGMPPFQIRNNQTIDN